MLLRSNKVLLPPSGKHPQVGNSEVGCSGGMTLRSKKFVPSISSQHVPVSRKRKPDPVEEVLLKEEARTASASLDPPQVVVTAVKPVVRPKRRSAEQIDFRRLAGMTVGPTETPTDKQNHSSTSAILTTVSPMRFIPHENIPYKYNSCMSIHPAPPPRSATTDLGPQPTALKVPAPVPPTPKIISSCSLDLGKQSRTLYGDTTKLICGNWMNKIPQRCLIEPKDRHIWWQYARDVCVLNDEWIRTEAERAQSRCRKGNCFKMASLRKESLKYMAVVFFHPDAWGKSNKKRLKLYNSAKKCVYGWDDSVPFLPINSGSGRAHIGDLLRMKDYLLHRFRNEVLPFLHFRTRPADSWVEINNDGCISDSHEADQMSTVSSDATWPYGDDYSNLEEENDVPDTPYVYVDVPNETCSSDSSNRLCVDLPDLSCNNINSINVSEALQGLVNLPEIKVEYGNVIVSLFTTPIPDYLDLDDELFNLAESASDLSSTSQLDTNECLEFLENRNPLVGDPWLLPQIPFEALS